MLTANPSAASGCARPSRRDGASARGRNLSTSVARFFCAHLPSASIFDCSHCPLARSLARQTRRARSTASKQSHSEPRCNPLPRRRSSHSTMTRASRCILLAACALLLAVSSQPADAQDEQQLQHLPLMHSILAGMPSQGVPRPAADSNAAPAPQAGSPLLNLGPNALEKMILNTMQQNEQQPSPPQQPPSPPPQQPASTPPPSPITPPLSSSFADLPALRHTPVPEIHADEFEQLMQLKRPLLVNFFAPVSGTRRWDSASASAQEIVDVASARVFRLDERFAEAPHDRSLACSVSFSGAATAWR
jgi:hypothetical protein